MTEYDAGGMSFRDHVTTDAWEYWGDLDRDERFAELDHCTSAGRYDALGDFVDKIKRRLDAKPESDYKAGMLRGTLVLVDGFLLEEAKRFWIEDEVDRRMSGGREIR